MDIANIQLIGASVSNPYMHLILHILIQLRSWAVQPTKAANMDLAVIRASVSNT